MIHRLTPVAVIVVALALSACSNAPADRTYDPMDGVSDSIMEDEDGAADQMAEETADEEAQASESSAHSSAGETTEDPAEAAPPEPVVVEPTPAFDFAGTMEALRSAIEEATEEGEPLVMLDAPFPGKNRWEIEEWSNGATLELNSAAICLTAQAGPRGKWVASITQPLDLSDYDRVMLEVKAEGDLAVALGIWTGEADDPALFESTPVAVQAGDWREVKIPLGGTGFKSAGTDWEFGSELEGVEDVQRFSIFVYAAEPTDLCWRRIRLATE